MADLSVNFAGIKFKNPIVASAGPIAGDLTTIKKCIEAGVGGVTARSITPDKQLQLFPRPADWFLDKFGGEKTLMHIHGALWSPEQALKYLEEIKPLAEKQGVVLIGSFFFVGDWATIPPEDGKHKMLIDLAKKVEAAGVDAIEVLCVCPLFMSRVQTVDVQKMVIPLIINSLKGNLTVPFWLKISDPFESFFLKNLKTIESMGCNSVHVLSDVRETLVDVNVGKSLLSAPVTYGPSKRGCSCYTTYLAASHTKLQVMSSGGIWTWRDAVERLMCGATISSLQTAVQYGGYEIFKEIIQGLSGFLDGRDYQSVNEIVGLAIPHIDNPQEFLQFIGEHAVPKELVEVIVDAGKCNGCRKCLACNWGAITMKDNIADINLELCERCGVCASICPTDAIIIEKR